MNFIKILNLNTIVFPITLIFLLCRPMKKGNFKLFIYKQLKDTFVNDLTIKELNLNYTHDKMKWIDVTVHKKNACILVRPD
jgi:hypothetical protein